MRQFALVTIASLLLVAHQTAPVWAIGMRGGGGGGFRGGGGGGGFRGGGGGGSFRGGGGGGSFRGGGGMSSGGFRVGGGGSGGGGGNISNFRSSSGGFHGGPSSLSSFRSSGGSGGGGNVRPGGSDLGSRLNSGGGGRLSGGDLGARLNPGGGNLSAGRLDGLRPGSGGAPSSQDLRSFLNLPAGGQAGRPGTGGGQRPLGPGGEQRPLGPGGEQRPLGPGGEQRPLGPGGEQRPLGPGGEQRPLGPGGEQRPLGPGGERRPLGPGGEQRRLGPGGEQTRASRAYANARNDVPRFEGNRDQRVARRDARANQIRRDHPWRPYNRPFTQNWWRRRPYPPPYGPWRNWWRRPYYGWGWAAWGGLTGFLVGSSFSQPIYYDYGSNVYYDSGSVYIDGQEAATATEYAEQAEQIANDGTPSTSQSGEMSAEEAKNWMPLGVYALTNSDKGDATMYLQLAISKDGKISGTYYNTMTNQNLPVYGSVDEKTQRAAWYIGTNKDTVMETGLYNLTKPQTPILVHFGKDKTQQWLMVHLDQPKEDGSGGDENSEAPAPTGNGEKAS
ncbi:hypothetical protein Pan216_26940 [Planctomycetes bacterium Pan216]|uniref:Mu-protocadherin-putative cell-suface protein n=1 Tax=Kolteria novifilia TaxID=2527975 RepID=A0A518B4B5_9BACT|nr:hypothetical protein Pan216_26940 [Planctomycetes bacterium Pan216]